jgi:hypothetical protein
MTTAREADANHGQQVQLGKAVRRYVKAQKEVRDAFNALPPCGAVIHHGGGHQSTSRCERRGPHKQHAIESYGFYWSKMKAFSGYFNESPEEPEDA